ncbi:MAG TPA: hypothetical protein VMW24_11755, partial [Sedimentisphaerales bacterium]|nr:hypothetical protein [Sedimentisphaerales bacterium]
MPIGCSIGGEKNVAPADLDFSVTPPSPPSLLPVRRRVTMRRAWHLSRGIGMDRSDKLFVLVVIVAVAAALFLAFGRARIEQANRTVEIVIDGDDARLVAAASGKTLPV